MRFLHLHMPDWPDLIEDHLTDELETQLAPFLSGMRSAADLKKLSMHDVLLGGLSWTHRRQLDEEAPTHIQVPSGSRIPVDYSNPEDPILAVRLQEMFGQQETRTSEAVACRLRCICYLRRNDPCRSQEIWLISGVRRISK